jgi:hypothetical protein
VDFNDIKYLIITVSVTENLEMVSEDLSRMESHIVQAVKEKYQNITILDKTVNVGFQPWLREVIPR